MAAWKRKSVNRRQVSGASIAGFTLLEVLVALFVVTLGMTAVFMQLNQYAISANYTRDKTLASWIASNRLTELSIQPSWPELGDQTDTVEFANREWRLEITTSETDVQNLRRVDVSVSFEETPDNIVHEVSALIEPPAPPGFAPMQWLSAPAGTGG